MTTRCCCCWILLLAIGCGNPTAQISGRVEFEDGSSIPGSAKSITFTPTDDTTAMLRTTASGHIDDDGNFKMQGRKPTDGVQKGQYVVTIMALKSPRLGGLLVPEKYTVTGSTPLKIDVTRNQDDILFQLEELD